MITRQAEGCRTTKYLGSPRVFPSICWMLQIAVAVGRLRNISLLRAEYVDNCFFPMARPA